MIQQGNDTVKEGMIFVEDELLRSRQDIDPERTAVYGFSGGGT
jgi:dipeptidyl aminopeptidase/acylaminoacyl peptidase